MNSKYEVTKIYIFHIISLNQIILYIHKIINLNINMNTIFIHFTFKLSIM
mgnify:CR=1 FL=1